MLSYLSFNLNYYKSKLQQYEQHTCSAEELYEARQLLKLLDDVVDEGYTALYKEMEKQFQGVTRLHTLLSSYGVMPFSIPKSSGEPARFEGPEVELNTYLEQLMFQAQHIGISSTNPFLDEILGYCNWIGDVPDCTYVFLLRDALLPYLYFKKHKRPNIEPWLIGRKYMDLLYPGCELDDIIRASFLDALEYGCSDFKSFHSFCKERIVQDLQLYPEVIRSIQELLSTIQTSKILVIESGCYGTFPMLLSVLDERVEFKMYTTVPYLSEVYKDHIYTKAYENIRLFETITCQDRLFQLSSVRGNGFYVKVNGEKMVLEEAVQEVRRV